jgi:hypothetical protein
MEAEQIDVWKATGGMHSLLSESFRTPDYRVIRDVKVSAQIPKVNRPELLSEVTWKHRNPLIKNGQFRQV